MLHITRRRFLTISAAATVSLGFSAKSLRASEVPWLKDVQKPPKSGAADAPPLSPLLRASDGKEITTREAWQPERRRLRQAWLDFLGPMPAERPPLAVEVLRQDAFPGGTRQLLRYETEAGLPVEGYLLRPDPNTPGRDQTTGKRAGLVALHQTSKATIDEIAGVTGPESQHLALKLVRRGFVVFCPRCFLWQSVENYQQAVDTFNRRHPGTLGMHKMLWDASRGVDVLETLADEVDVKRLGAVGHSLGAKETLYLAAFDERIAVAVASEGGIGFQFTNWDAPWYLGPRIREEGFPRNHHELLALIAPRPFLILAGESGSGAADGDRSWPYVAAAMDVYKLYGSPARLGLYNHREGHTISEATFERLAQWLTMYLKVV
jgi:hypothetical protein